MDDPGNYRTYGRKAKPNYPYDSRLEEDWHEYLTFLDWNPQYVGHRDHYRDFLVLGGDSLEVKPDHSFTEQVFRRMDAAGLRFCILAIGNPIFAPATVQMQFCYYVPGQWNRYIFTMQEVEQHGFHRDKSWTESIDLSRGLRTSSPVSVAH